MGQDLFGRVVCVRSPLIDGSGWLAEVWFVAIDDDVGAVDAVHASERVSVEDEVIVIGQLEPDALRKLALAPGHAVAYPDRT